MSQTETAREVGLVIPLEDHRQADRQDFLTK